MKKPRKVRERLRLHYSDVLSIAFWQAIKRIKDPAERTAAYIMGCNLQDIECRTVRYVNELLERKGRERLTPKREETK